MQIGVMRIPIPNNGLLLGVPWQSPPEQRCRAEGSLPAAEKGWKKIVLQCMIQMRKVNKDDFKLNFVFFVYFLNIHSTERKGKKII